MGTWIFLRGLTRETAHWGRFPDDFQNAISDSRVICLDLPGNGQLHQMPSLLSIAAMVSYCRNELTRRGEKPPYYLLAMSLGAMVAAEWSGQVPAEVAGCVLINTSFKPFSPFYQRLRPRNYLALVKLAMLRQSAENTERGVLQLTSHSASMHEMIISGWVATRLHHPVSRLNALRQLVAAARYRARLAAPATHLLMLASKQDQLVNVECSITIASRWQCQLELHPSAGHDIPLDDPLWLCDQVERWLGESCGRRSPSSS